MESKFTPQDLVLLFGTTVPTSLLQEAVAHLKPVPKTARTAQALEAHSASNVRAFLKHLFPDTLFSARYSRDTVRNLTTLRVHWPQLPQSPSNKTVQEVLSPFVDKTLSMSPPSPQHRAASEVFRGQFGGVPCIGFWPRAPEKSDIVALANRRQELLASSLVVEEPSARVNKPRM